VFHPPAFISGFNDFTMMSNWGSDREIGSWKKMDTIIITRIPTPGCVSLTAMEGFSCDFKVIILEDRCAAHKSEINDTFMSVRKMMSLGEVSRQ
jgi:nicotinamidase-related amidase